MRPLPEILSKKALFAILNAGMVGSLLVSGELRLDTISIISSVVVLGLMNGVALLSARYYKGWK